MLRTIFLWIALLNASLLSAYAVISVADTAVSVTADVVSTGVHVVTGVVSSAVDLVTPNKNSK